MEKALPSLAGMNRAEIEAALGDIPSARMRAAQICKWVYAKACASFDEMHDIPAELRRWLSERFVVSPLQVSRHLKSSDGVEKLLVHGGDAQVYECVLLPYDDRVSCCISSQVGCPMGCQFCATGLGGFDRNLTPGEIIGQYLLLQRVRRESVAAAQGRDEAVLERRSRPEPVRERISHVVFMGMGEPLLNLPNVLKTLNLLHTEVGLSYRHLTVSTVGIVPQIDELASAGLPIHLALSLHSPFDAIRDRLMPVNKKWKVAEVIDSMKRYARTTGRKITIEYLLIESLTDTLDQAAELARLIRGTPSVVNVIPFNYVQTEQGFSRPSRTRVKAFKSELKRLGVNVTERMERGHDIAAACGQLAGEHAGRMAKRRNLSVVSGS